MVKCTLRSPDSYILEYIVHTLQRKGETIITGQLLDLTFNFILRYWHKDNYCQLKKLFIVKKKKKKNTRYQYHNAHKAVEGYIFSC